MRLKSSFYICLLLVLSTFFWFRGCGSVTPDEYFAQVTPDGRSPLKITGLASWYGPKFHGQTTASGDIYDMHQFTAAHKELPFGTFVRVINTRNNKGVIVRINDRGPFIKGRVVDLSFRAAKAIGMITDGVVPVVVEVVKYPE